MRLKFLLICGVLAIGTVVLWRFAVAPVAESQARPALAFADEFVRGGKRLSYQATREAVRDVINCYFNKAIQVQMQQGNQAFSRSVKAQEFPGQPPSEADLGCEAVTRRQDSIAYRLFAELNATLAAIPQNQTRVATTAAPRPTASTGIEVCNFSRADSPEALRMLSVDAANDYFAVRRTATISPTYAAYTVAHCYRLMYLSYLERYFANPSTVGDAVPWDDAVVPSAPPRILTEVPLRQEQARQQEYLRERIRVEAALEQSVAAVDTLSETYPLHVRYAQLIEHSKEFRDQVRRFRVAMDQLVPKLINQTTRNQ